MPEGIEGRVPYKGPLLAGDSSAAWAVCAPAWVTPAAPDIEEMRTKPEVRARHQRRHGESHVHDVQITKEAPNYRV